ncbi:MAG: hypothetical protein ACI9R3_005176, partial [Verrucomicrobiales bacterium]
MHCSEVIGGGCLHLRPLSGSGAAGPTQGRPPSGGKK